MPESYENVLPCTSIVKTQVWVGQYLFFCSLKYLIFTKDGLATLNKETFFLFIITILFM